MNHDQFFYYLYSVWKFPKMSYLDFYAKSDKVESLIFPIFCSTRSTYIANIWQNETSWWTFKHCSSLVSLDYIHTPTCSVRPNCSVRFGSSVKSGVRWSSVRFGGSVKSGFYRTEPNFQKMYDSEKNWVTDEKYFEFIFGKSWILAFFDLKRSAWTNVIRNIC